MGKFTSSHIKKIFDYIMYCAIKFYTILREFKRYFKQRRGREILQNGRV